MKEIFITEVFIICKCSTDYNVMKLICYTW